mmetsp:Transcript_755/g.1264  ORF Transcript_755/g.1264 Transcript_755/m.1264 type:complete len:212 (-) Transcript_755:56-691(-)|eukprot:CAMPEP_0184702726 /NCGR_PEP_ID=MMETSP0313-20130426/25296_1 /TAXON_ID=2792 /ORGANISM="Porphyridium aerugineum, Strain SAG 1380-2" /LENGTH=211 /DNA_ID=CAMNT_0027163293 /DNA_START=30 /DNA_END=665 /DNA_ORIENTATION=-
MNVPPTNPIALGQQQQQLLQLQQQHQLHQQIQAQQAAQTQMQTQTQSQAQQQHHHQSQMQMAGMQPPGSAHQLQHSQPTNVNTPAPIPNNSINNPTTNVDLVNAAFMNNVATFDNLLTDFLRKVQGALHNPYDITTAKGDVSSIVEKLDLIEAHVNVLGIDCFSVSDGGLSLDEIEAKIVEEKKMLDEKAASFAEPLGTVMEGLSKSSKEP